MVRVIKVRHNTDEGELLKKSLANLKFCASKLDQLTHPPLWLAQKKQIDVFPAFRAIKSNVFFLLLKDYFFSLDPLSLKSHLWPRIVLDFSTQVNDCWTIWHRTI